MASLLEQPFSKQKKVTNSAGALFSVFHFFGGVGLLGTFLFFFVLGFCFILSKQYVVILFWWCFWSSLLVLSCCSLLMDQALKAIRLQWHPDKYGLPRFFVWKAVAAWGCLGRCSWEEFCCGFRVFLFTFVMLFWYPKQDIMDVFPLSRLKSLPWWFLNAHTADLIIFDN